MSMTVSAGTAINPFRVHVPQADFDDLHDRLARIRLPDEQPLTAGVTARGPTWPGITQRGVSRPRCRDVPRRLTKCRAESRAVLHSRYGTWLMRPWRLRPHQRRLERRREVVCVSLGEQVNGLGSGRISDSAATVS